MKIESFLLSFSKQILRNQVTSWFLSICVAMHRLYRKVINYMLKVDTIYICTQCDSTRIRWNVRTNRLIAYRSNVWFQYYNLCQYFSVIIYDTAIAVIFIDYIVFHLQGDWYQLERVYCKWIIKIWIRWKTRFLSWSLGIRPEKLL